MLKDHLNVIFKSHLEFHPTSGQELLIEALSQMMTSCDDRQLLVIKGYAGTGKTSLIAAFIKTLNTFNIRFLLMAPTGRAAKILNAYSGAPAYTVHKKIYRMKTGKDGLGSFSLNFNGYSNAFFIVDEASMIAHHSHDQSMFGSGSLLDDLIMFTYNNRNCRLILVGDTAQLPPVGQELSLALDKKHLESYGLQVSEYELNEVVRQKQESAILYNATNVRKQISGNNIMIPSFQINELPDMEKISGNEFIESLSDAYDRYGIDGTVVICRSNKQANQYNRGIRNRILYREEELTPGDYLMIVKNNYFWIKDSEEINFIANGDIARVQKINKYIERYDFRFAEIELLLPDYNDYELTAIIMLDVLNSEVASLTGEQNKKLYYSIAEDYTSIRSKKKQYQEIRENPFFNALQVKFSYAVTCHKAQGGQWPCVFLDQGWINNDLLQLEYLRWLYTAITRASEKLYLVNFPDRFFL